MDALTEALRGAQLAQLDVDQAMQKISPARKISRVGAVPVLVGRERVLAAAFEVAQGKISVAQAVRERRDQERFLLWDLGNRAVDRAMQSSMSSEQAFVAACTV